MSSIQEWASLSHTDQVNKIIDTNQLRPSVEYLQIRLDGLELADAIMGHATATTSFLKKFPLEIRINIYEFALVNLFLSDPEAIHPSRSQFGAGVQYHLSPAILRTCKQIYNEALPILYGKNVFVISGLGGTWDHSPWPKLIECPLSRYLMEIPLSRFRYLGPHSSHYCEFVKSAPFRRVRNWKLIFSPHAGTHRPHLSIQDFCRSVIDNSLASLTVFAMSQPMYENWTGSPLTYHRQIPASKQLASVKILRKVGKVYFEDFGGNTVSSALQAEIRAAAESYGIVHHVFNMYQCLLRYAQAFERDRHTRDSMEMPRWCDRSEFASFSAQRGVPRYENALDDLSRLRFNLFATISPHPVEAALELAKFASDDNDFEAFKVQRKIILDFLEPQYQRIASSSDIQVKFVKEHKTQHALLGRLWRDLPQDLSAGDLKVVLEATVLLERYAKTFARDLTPEIELIVRLHQKQYDQDYMILEREKALADMSDALDQRQWGLWKQHFRTAVEDMDKQYLQMRELRKGLFAGDTVGADPGCELDIEAWRFDEQIVWNVNEPEMGP